MFPSWLGGHMTLGMHAEGGKSVTEASVERILLATGCWEERYPAQSVHTRVFLNPKVSQTACWRHES